MKLIFIFAAVFTIAYGRRIDTPAQGRGHQDMARIVPEKGKDGSLSGYIFMITRNEVMDWYRHRAPAVKLQERLAEEVSDAVHNMYDTIDTRLISDVIGKSVMAMPPVRREVFVSSRYFGMPHKEISRKFGISKRTVEKHISLALKQIRNDLSLSLGIGSAELSFFFEI